MSRISKFIAAFLIPFTAFGAPFGGMPFAYWKTGITSVSWIPTLIMVAGGGGGGGSGGWAKYYVYYSPKTLHTGTTYTVTIGAGGAGGTGLYTQGSNGGNTVLSGSDVTTLTTYGGGGGGANAGDSTQNGLNGGSGGGAGGYGGLTGTGGTGSQGGSGGASNPNDPYTGGGGGGIGSNGYAGTDNTGQYGTYGEGGSGNTTSYSGGIDLSNQSFGGGGGGGDYNDSTSYGVGGQQIGSGSYIASIHVGGNGAAIGVASTVGQPQKGGGGGGGGNGQSGSAGGSGLLITTAPQAYGFTYTGTPVLQYDSTNSQLVYNYYNSGTFNMSTTGTKFNPTWNTLGLTTNYVLNMTQDSSGNTYVLSSANKSGGGGYTVIKIDTSNTITDFITLSEQAAGITVDGSGNIFVSCVYSTNVYKYNSSGTLLTTYNLASGGHTNSLANPIVHDSSNNIYIFDYNNKYICKISSSGTVTTNFINVGYGSFINVDSSNNIYTTGFSSGIIKKYNSSGTQQYSVNTGSSGLSTPVIDSSGNAWVMSCYNAVTSNMSSNVYKINSSGTITTYTVTVWNNDSFVYYGNQPVGNQPVVFQSAIDNNNNVYFAEKSSGVVYVLNNSGTQLSGYYVGPVFTTIPYVLCSTSDGNVLAYGQDDLDSTTFNFAKITH